ncbi:MAG TPA: ADP-ribosylglycohydrolase family protein, partial [Syntrophorhabdus sp.]|nr:ADP-ribosylglycohydrolase family protein [Syntrophorhabdus sp.]
WGTFYPGVQRTFIIAGDTDCYAPIPDYWKDHTLAPEIEDIARGSYKEKNPPEIKGTGYVVQSLEAALWAFHKGDSFEEGCLIAVNLGDDADTTGAVYGQIAGAYYGEGRIPLQWLSVLALRYEIMSFMDSLFHGNS